MRIEELLIRVKDDSRDTIYCDGDVYSYKNLYEPVCRKSPAKAGHFRMYKI